MESIDYRNETSFTGVSNGDTGTLYIRCRSNVCLTPKKEALIWNKFAVGMLAIATIAAASVLLRRNRPVEVTAGDQTDESKGVEGLYAAGL